MAVGKCPGCSLIVLKPIVTCASIGEPDIYECDGCGMFQGDRLIRKRRVCLKCGHLECPCCGNWCDEIVGEDELCCDGKCSYG